MTTDTPLTQSLACIGLNDQLPVVPESTTSRVVVNNPLLRTVLFTFDAGQALTEHSSPRAVVVTLLAGELEFVLEGETHLMNPGDVIYLAPGAPHALTALSACRLQLVMVTPGPEA